MYIFVKFFSIKKTRFMIIFKKNQKIGFLSSKTLWIERNIK
jgi:hypothetical protein